MIKYYNAMVVFEEIPNEISLAINITNCPCHCPGCHSKFLWEDIGTELTTDELSKLIKENDGITCVCFMGGDADTWGISDLARFVRNNYDLKVGWYSGREKINVFNDIYPFYFDYIKIGPYIEEKGGLDKPTTNQKLFKVMQGKNINEIELEDITNLFWKNQ